MKEGEVMRLSDIKQVYKENEIEFFCSYIIIYIKHQKETYINSIN